MSDWYNDMVACVNAGFLEDGNLPSELAEQFVTDYCDKK